MAASQECPPLAWRSFLSNCNHLRTDLVICGLKMVIVHKPFRTTFYLERESVEMLDFYSAKNATNCDVDFGTERFKSNISHQVQRFTAGNYINAFFDP